MNKKLLLLYGLKWNPFSPEVPTEALLATPAIESFCWRVEHTLVREGGFGLITGDVGTGKSVTLRILAERLGNLREVQVGELAHPQSMLRDFYRELGDLFGVALKAHNRWHSFKSLRSRWKAHIESTLVRPILLIDEAQEMRPEVLSELRLLSSTRFDSRIILTVILAGDGRLQDMLRRDDLLPLGSRIRCRLSLEYATRDELQGCLQHLLRTAGNPKLMTPELQGTLCEHAMGNYRVLTTMAAELLAAAAQQDADRLDEKLFFELFQPEKTRKRRKRSA